MANGLYAIVMGYLYTHSQNKLETTTTIQKSLQNKPQKKVDVEKKPQKRLKLSVTMRQNRNKTN